MYYVKRFTGIGALERRERGAVENRERLHSIKWESLVALGHNNKICFICYMLYEQCRHDPMQCIHVSQSGITAFNNNSGEKQQDWLRSPAYSSLTTAKWKRTLHRHSNIDYERRGPLRWTKSSQIWEKEREE